MKVEPSVYSDLLVRWYQLSVHLPIMRVHSTHSALPHFPFLYGETPGDAMRAAMNRRYQLVPYHYSNAHAMYAAGRPMMRPLLMDFPSDAAASELTTQWMDGDALLVAPIVTSPEGPEVRTPHETSSFPFIQIKEGRLLTAVGRPKKGCSTEIRRQCPE